MRTGNSDNRNLPDRPHPLRILHVEDDERDTRLIQIVLNKIPIFDIDCDHVFTAREALNALGHNNYDVILLDLNLPDATGLNVLKIIHETAPDKPIVIVSGAEDTLLSLDAVRQGAEEFLIKGQLDSKTIMRAIRYAIDHKSKEVQLVQLSHYDQLTGLLNRNLLKERLVHALSRSKRLQMFVALMFIDLDYFKLVNDTFGHKTGDLLLQEVAARLQQCVREEDSVARFGGDEFIILLEGIRDQSAAVVVAEKVLKSLAASYHLDGNHINITASIGISLRHGSDGIDIDSLLNVSDNAMYRVKSNGRNGYQFLNEE